MGGRVKHPGRGHVLRCLPLFFDGVLHGVLSNSRMPSGGLSRGVSKNIALGDMLNKINRETINAHQAEHAAAV